MTEAIIVNLTAPTRIVSTVNAHDMCYGIIGVNLLIMILVLLTFNFLSFFYYKNLAGESVKMFNKDYPLVWFIPVVNFSVLIYIFVYAYNAW